MIHDTNLLKTLIKFTCKPFSGTVYRATRKNLDPTAPSTNSGRWGPRGNSSILYTALTKETALAEIAFYLGQLNPLPTKPVVVNELRINAVKVLHLLKPDFSKLGLNKATYHNQNFECCQKIGAATVFLGFDGLIVPSARWNNDNFILFSDNTKSDAVELIRSEEVDWRTGFANKTCSNGTQPCCSLRNRISLHDKQTPMMPWCIKPAPG